MSAAGIYLHVPFCAAKCPYCDFYSAPGDSAAHDAYAAAMLRAFAALPPEKTPPAANSIYFGGGTPSLLGAARLAQLLAAARARFCGGLPDVEVTLEANPCDVTPALLRDLVAAGFGRISFGVQSLCGQTLRTLGRRHNAQTALDALAAAQQAGFAHISADLMLGVPGQTLAEIDENIDRLAQTPIDHLSAYLLKIEPGTAYAARYPDWAAQSDDFLADCYLAAAQRCARHGFAQYEISNFAKSTAAQSRHNLKYWRCAPYLGVGPAAHSFVAGQRFWMPRDTAAFCAASDPWSLAQPDGSGGDEQERLLLGLRLTEGIRLADFAPATAAQLRQRAAPLQAAGLLTLRESDRAQTLALTVQGFLVSNAVIAALLA